MSISVVIPVTRVIEVQMCLENLVKSFAAARVENYEVLLIKDKSCQLSFKSLDENSFIKILNCESMHPSIRRNYGVKHAVHSIIAFVDDDVYVPVNWVDHVLKSIKSCDGVCGPIIQSRFTSALKNIVGLAQESFFSEGFHDHRNFKTESRFYDIPLCNVVIHRGVWESVGGFNEVADYNIDDCEFFYLAEKKGYKFYNEPELAVEHDLIPLGWSFIRKKILQRYKGGINSMVFREIYFNYTSVRLVWLSYLLLFLLIVVQCIYPLDIKSLSLMALGIYFLAAYGISALKIKSHPVLALFLPFVFFLIHIVDYFSYTAGVLYYLVFRNQFDLVLEHKRKRMA